MSLEEFMKDRRELTKFLEESKRSRVKVALTEAVAKLEKEIINLEIKIRKRNPGTHSKSCSGEKRKHWTHDETRALLSCYVRRREEFNCFRKKRNGYKNVLKDLIDLNVLVTPTTPEGVQNKMKALLRAYKKANIANAGKAKCIEPFDRELDDIFGSAVAMNKKYDDIDDVQEEGATTESFSSLYESDASNILKQTSAGGQAMVDVSDCIEKKHKILWTPQENDVRIVAAGTYKPLSKSDPSSTYTLALAEKLPIDEYGDIDIDEKPSILWTAEENLDAAAINDNDSSSFIASTNILKRKSTDDKMGNANDDANEEERKRYRITFKERAFKEKITFLKEKEDNKMKRWEEKKEMLRLQTENRKREKQQRFEEKLKLMKKLTEVIKKNS